MTHSSLHRNFYLSVNSTISFCCVCVFYTCVLGTACVCVCVLSLFLFFFFLRTTVVWEVCQCYPLFFYSIFPKIWKFNKNKPLAQVYYNIWNGGKTENFTLSSLFQRSGTIICPNATGGSWLLSGLAFKDIQSRKQKLKSIQFLHRTSRKC